MEKHIKPRLHLLRNKGAILMQVIIDRFESFYAVCEKDDRTMINIKRNLIPPEAKEGDVLDIEDNEILINFIETEKRKRKFEELTKELWN